MVCNGWWLRVMSEVFGGGFQGVVELGVVVGGCGLCS